MALPTMNAGFLSLLTLTFLVGCGDDSPKHDKVGKHLGKDRQALIFAGVDAQATSSTLYNLDTETFETSVILEGQSGDPLVVERDDRLFFFNRGMGNLNFREISLNEDSFELTSQTAIENTVLGDPHDVAILENNQALLSNFNGGFLSLVNMDTGLILKVIDENWDIPNEDPLRPENLAYIPGQEAGSGKILVLHQGLNREFAPNDSQQIFVLEVKDNNVTTLDLDKKKGRIQGIKLKTTNPTLFCSKDGSPFCYVAGFCYKSFVKTCEGSLQKINTETFKVETIFEFPAETYTSFGNIIAGKDENEFYANVETTKGKTAEHRIVKINIADGVNSISEIHKFPNIVFSGYWGTYFDRQNNLLYVGDRKDTINGQFTIYKNDRRMKTFDVNGIPYSGTFLH